MTNDATPDNPRDCPHGHRLGKCDTCDLIEVEREITAADARIRVLTKDVAELAMSKLKWFNEFVAVARARGSAEAQRDSLEITLAEKDAKIAELEAELADVDRRFNGHLNKMWGLAYPGNTDWDYPGMVYRHVRDVLAEKDAEIARLTDAFVARGVEIERLNHALNKSLNDREIDAAGLGQTIMELRETVTRLNRRATQAEGAVMEKASSGGSLGRMLANASASVYMRRCEELGAENERLQRQVEAMQEALKWWVGGDVDEEE